MAEQSGSSSEEKQKIKDEIEALAVRIKRIDREITRREDQLDELGDPDNQLDDVLTPGADSQKAERDKLNREIKELEEEKEEAESKATILAVILSIQEAVGKKVSQFRSYLPLVKVLVDENKDVLTDILTLFLDSLYDLSEGMEDQIDRGSKITAERSFKKFQHFKEAGFNEDQAMTLLIVSKLTTSDLSKHYSTMALNSSSDATEKLRGLSSRLRNGRGFQL